jgi:hypothetical protein
VDYGRRISSRNTFFLKRVLPTLMFGVLALGIAALLLLSRGRAAALPWPALIAPLAMAVICYLLGRGAAPLNTSAPNTRGPLAAA